MTDLELADTLDRYATSFEQMRLLGPLNLAARIGRDLDTLLRTASERMRLLDHAMNTCETHAHVEGIRQRTACAVCLTDALDRIRQQDHAIAHIGRTAIEAIAKSQLDQAQADHMTEIAQRLLDERLDEGQQVPPAPPTEGKPGAR